VLHALHHGCPVVTVPGHAEQAVTAMAVEQARVGRVVSAPEVIHSPQRLVEATRALCAQPTWAQAAAALPVDGAQAEPFFLDLLTDYARLASTRADPATEVS
jgi:UDP:flavonoid glycosyltransferase YjiC (YdhE family)